MNSCRTFLALACLAVLGCQPAGHLAQADGPDVALHTPTTVRVAGRTLHLHGADGKPISNVAVMLGGKIYQVGQDGGLALGPKDATPVGSDTIMILSPGYTPLRVPAGTGEQDLTLVPAASLAVAHLGGTGGKLEATAAGVGVSLPAGMLATDGAGVALSTYTPPAADGATAAARDQLAAKLGKTACDQPLPCAPLTTALGLLVTVDGTLQPGQLAVSLDLAKLAAGTPDQAAAAQRIQQTFAAIDATGDPAWRTTLAKDYGVTLANGVLGFSVTIGDNAVRDGLVKVEVDGLAVLGTLLEVTVVSAANGFLPPGASQPGLQDPTSGAGGGTGLAGGPGGIGGTGGITGTGTGTGTTGTGTTGTGTAGTGTTGTGGIGGTGGTGGSLITENGAGIIANNGSGFLAIRADGLITENGAGLITENGAGIIANNGGGFSGQVRVPFLQELSKYHALTYTDYPWQGVQLRAVDAVGKPYGTGSAQTNGVGQYTLGGLPGTHPVVFLEAYAGGYQLATLAPAPGAGQVVADVDAATTGMTALVADEIQQGRFSNLQINLGGYADDVAYLRNAFVQADAQFCVSNKVDVVAAYVRNFFASRGVKPETLMRVSSVGPTIPYLYHLTTDGAGNVLAIGNNQLHRITPAGMDSVLGSFTSPLGVAVDGAGNAYVSDGGPHQIFQVTPAGATSVYAGFPRPGWNASGSTNYADGDAGTARFGQPDGLGFGPNGKLYVADFFNFRIRQVDPAAGPASPAFVTTVAGSGPTSPTAAFLPSNVPPMVDGPAGTAGFGQLEGLAVGPAGEVYVVDINNHAIRKLAGGQVTTVAGGGGAGYADGPAGAARFNYPVAVAVDRRGIVYVADTGNNCIRKIDTSLPSADPRYVTTLAGTPTPGYAGGTLAATRFNGPYGIWVDAAGAIYVSDQGNNQVRVLR